VLAQEGAIVKCGGTIAVTTTQFSEIAVIRKLDALAFEKRKENLLYGVFN
jgi:hypothetical protein